LFVELSEGMKALAEERLGKRTLRTHLKNKLGGPSEVLSRYSHVTG
jgi:hypothetical protein